MVRPINAVKEKKQIRCCAEHIYKNSNDDTAAIFNKSNRAKLFSIVAGLYPRIQWQTKLHLNLDGISDKTKCSHAHQKEGCANAAVSGVADSTSSRVTLLHSQVRRSIVTE